MCIRDRARQQSGAQKLSGHDIMALERFDPATRHMIVFDAVSYTHLQVSEGVRDFTSSVTQTRTARAEQRNAQAESRRQTIAERRAELEQAKQPQKTASEVPKGAAPVHERPVTAKQPEDFRHHADTAHAGKPAMQPASSSIRERGQVPYGGTVAERASVPVVKAASIHLSLIHISKHTNSRMTG